MDRVVASMHIVVPIDVASRSVLALETARTMVGPGDEITLIHVLPLLDIPALMLMKSHSAEALMRELRDDARKQLHGICANTPMPAGVRLRSIVIDGNPGEEIVHFSSRPGTSMVVMETAGKGAANRMMLGSVADHVARSATVPVLLVREAGDGSDRAVPFNRIVVPLDGSRRAESALPVVAYLAKRLDVAVELISVKPPENTSFYYGAAFSISAYEEIDAGLLRQMRGALNAAKGELGRAGINATSTLLSGPVALSLEDALLPGDLVVMTSHGRSGVRRWLLGSVSEHLVRKGLAPVLLVPSAEFAAQNGRLDAVAAL